MRMQHIFLLRKKTRSVADFEVVFFLKEVLENESSSKRSLVFRETSSILSKVATTTCHDESNQTRFRSGSLLSFLKFEIVDHFKTCSSIQTRDQLSKKFLTLNFNLQSYLPDFWPFISVPTTSELEIIRGRLSNIFCYIPNPRTSIWLLSPDGAARIFFLPP